MTAAAIWSLVALLAGVGVGILSEWFWGVAIFVGVYVGSFAVRAAVESLLSAQSDEIDNDTEQSPGV